MSQLRFGLIRSRFETYWTTPQLREERNHQRLLLCHRGVSDREDSLVEFANSQGGLELSRHIVAELCGTETADQTVLNLKTLLVLERFRGSRYHVDPTSGCHLGDFIRLLNGDEVNNRRATLAQMVLSITRSRPDMCQDANDFVLAVNGEAPPPHHLGWLSDVFWRSRLDDKKCLGDATHQAHRCVIEGEETLRDLLEWEILDFTKIADVNATENQHTQSSRGKRELAGPSARF